MIEAKEVARHFKEELNELLKTQGNNRVRRLTNQVRL